MVLKYLKIFFAVFAFLLIPLAGKAAVLYMDPAEGQIGPGDSIVINFKLDISAACINTIEANISFPQDRLKLVEFLTGDSIINLWLDKPNSGNFTEINQKGLIHIVGGIPGGFCGRIPGDPGYSNNIGQAVFKAPGFSVGAEDSLTGQIDLSYLENTVVLINDGFGTKDELVTRGAVLSVINAPFGNGEAWQAPVLQDIIPPEPFVIELLRDPNIYDNKFYITFTTTDKQTGVDRYEVMEKKQIVIKAWWENLYDRLHETKEDEPLWQRAELLYILKDQGLTSVIQVKAVDKAGNERLAEYISPISLRPAVDSKHKLIFVVSFILIVTAVLIAFAWLSRRYLKHKKTHNHEEDL